jgi:hypothetical protein
MHNGCLTGLEHASDPVALGGSTPRHPRVYLESFVHLRPVAPTNEPYRVASPDRCGDPLDALRCTAGVWQFKLAIFAECENHFGERGDRVTSTTSIDQFQLTRGCSRLLSTPLVADFC